MKIKYIFGMMYYWCVIELLIVLNFESKGYVYVVG